MSESQRILIVSDDADFPRTALEQQGFEVAIATDCGMAFEELLRTPFDLAVVDLAPAQDGIEFIKRVRATAPLAGILILIAAEWGTGEPTRALSAGADAYEPKPFAASRLITSIERLLSRQAAAAN
jgi:DNA-binding response OmpR family regulator